MQIDLGSVSEFPAISKEAADERLGRAQQHLAHLRLFSAGLLKDSEVGPGILVVFEGFDAAGKGGAIRRLAQGLDPRHIRVVPVGPPSDIEKNHHFLWRFQSYLPGHGEMTVFDRSWYGRVLVERVDEIIDAETIERSYQEINNFEQALASDGTTIIKFWLHISEDEQLRRFEDRRDDPLKEWKLTDADWHNRKKRAAYVKAANEMLDRTDTPDAPWRVILANSKQYARVSVLEHLNEAIEDGLRRRGITPPSSHGHDYLG